MDDGLYIASSAMLTQFNVENNISDNLANLQTPGYKGHTPVLEDFLQVLQSSQDGEGPGVSTLPLSLGSIGQAPVIRDLGLDLAQGTPHYTGATFDTMIVGNGFFTVKSGTRTLLTRNGNFHLTAMGALVTNEGYAVLDATGKPITIPSGSTFSIDRGGVLLVNGVASGRLGLAQVPVGKPLTEASGGYYVGPGTAIPPGSTGVAVLQGYLEGSNVDLTTQTTAMMAAQRAYQADSQMLQAQDATLALAVTELGKVSG
jgi:flagellar basal body rod protein FlgG